MYGLFTELVCLFVQDSVSVKAREHTSLPQNLFIFRKLRIRNVLQHMPLVALRLHLRDQTSIKK